MIDVLVIGAGPAGLAAAAAAARHGVRVAVVEAASGVGGQFWRHLPESRPAAREESLHHGWKTFSALRKSLPDDVWLDAQVWAVERDGRRLVVHVAPAGGGELVTLRPWRVVLATGAHDRVLPVPGWTLPGVYTAGAAQAFAKAERLALGDRVVISGAGPFLLPVASSLARTGARVVGIYEASRWGRIAGGWGSRPWRLPGAAGKAGELAGYVATLLRNRIGYHAGEQVVAIHGTSRVEAVTVAKLDAQWRPVPGTGRRVECDTVCLAHGFTPRLELALAAGCALTPGRFVEVDAAQQTSVPGVFAAGEVTGLGGADLALASGEIAGWVAGGGGAADWELTSAVKARDTALAMAARLEAAHGIRPGWTEWLTPETTVCRCEDVTCGTLDAAVDNTRADGLRSYKLTTRAAMGLCQGRVCGRNVEQLLLARRGLAQFPETSTTDRRPVAVPITLGQLAGHDRKAEE